MAPLVGGVAAPRACARFLVLASAACCTAAASADSVADVVAEVSAEGSSEPRAGKLVRGQERARVGKAAAARTLRMAQSQDPSAWQPVDYANARKRSEEDDSLKKTEEKEGTGPDFVGSATSAPCAGEDCRMGPPLSTAPPTVALPAGATLRACRSTDPNCVNGIMVAPRETYTSPPSAKMSSNEKMIVPTAKLKERWSMQR